MPAVSKALVREILEAYRGDWQPLAVVRGPTVGAFSGMPVWRVQTPRGGFALRQWPATVGSRDKLRWIAEVLDHVVREGFSRVAPPLATRDGQRFVERQRHVWELAPWLNGSADGDATIRPQRLTAAMTALGQFHAAAATLPSGGDWGPGPGIVRRLGLLEQWREGRLAELSRRLKSGGAGWPELRAGASRVVELFAVADGPVERLLRRAALERVRLAPCLRDVRREHVLFEDDEVTGLIDYAAMELDHPATDVARLLGELVADDADGWRLGLEAYQRVRPTDAAFDLLLAAYDASGVLLSPLNWLSWIYEQERTFADRPGVVRRFSALVARLQRQTQPP